MTTFLATATRTLASALAVLLLTATASLAEPVTFRVEVAGLSCPFCAFGVEKELSRIDNVESIEVDDENDQLFVTLREGASLDAARVEQALRQAEARVREAVADAGFTLGSIERVD